jgi:hypothetical protein
MLNERRKVYVENQRTKLTSPGAAKQFYKTVRNYKTPEKPEVKSLYPGLEEGEVAEELAEFFNNISKEFDPLDTSEIPRTHDRHIPPLEVFQVAGRIRAFRKPSSRVPIDLFPDLMTKYADFIAVPLTSIFNEILSSNVWPVVWKREYVTVIPKKGIPTSPNDLRNISCTALASKIFESYILEWLKEEVPSNLINLEG